MYAGKKNCNMHLSRFILNLCNKSYRMNAHKLKYLTNLHGNIARLTVFFGGEGANKKRMDETLLVNKNRINLVYEAWYSVVYCLYVYISNKLHVLCLIKMNMEANDKSINCVQCLEAVIRVLFHIIVYLQFARWPQLATVWSPETR